MRLIDADKLIKQFDDDINIASEFAKKSIKYDDYRDFDKSFAILYMLKSYRAIVEDMPTAFDVDKVVSELEDYKMWKELLIYDLDFRERQIIKRALEIVKRGGIND